MALPTPIFTHRVTQQGEEETEKGYKVETTNHMSLHPSPGKYTPI